MPNAFQALKAAYELNPAALQARAVKLLAKFGIVLALCVASYMQGSWSKNDEWEAKIANQRVVVADQRTKNVIDAAQRLGDFVNTQARVDAAVQAAKSEVHAYYAANPPEPRLVEKTKLVPVPGKEEYVYVPIGTCPNDFLNADELFLWNAGRKGHSTDAANP